MKLQYKVVYVSRPGAGNTAGGKEWEGFIEIQNDTLKSWAEAGWILIQVVPVNEQHGRLQGVLFYFSPV